MKQIWVLKWATPAGLESYEQNNTPFYRVEHLEALLMESYMAGKEEGEKEGRVNFRKGLETGSFVNSGELFRWAHLAQDQEREIFNQEQAERLKRLEEFPNEP